MAICVNGMLEKGQYKVRVAKDGLPLLFKCTICARSSLFLKEILRMIMGNNYRKISAHIIARDNTALKLCNKGGGVRCRWCRERLINFETPEWAIRLS